MTTTSFAADLDALMQHLDLTDATLVGFSMGSGKVVRYLSTYGDARVSKAVLASAVPPYLYMSDDNPDGGLDDATVEQFEQGVTTDRLAFLEGFTTSFFAADDHCIAAFGRTDFRADLAKVTVPTLVIHGDSDGIVPFEVSGKRSAEAIPGSTLVVIEAGPHGITASHPEQFNEALVSFLAG